MKSKLLYLFLFAVGLSITLTTCVGEEGEDGRGDDSLDIEELIFSPSQISLFPGETETLLLFTVPNGYDRRQLTFSSSNQGVATVDTEGKVKAIAAGSAIITATAKNGVKGTCNVIVTSTLTKQMFATVQFASDVTVEFSLWGTGTMTIDWGDGTDIETHQLASYEEYAQGTGNISFKHTFYGASTCTVQLTAANIVHFGARFAHLISLDVSDNSALQDLDLYYNNITNLTLGANPSLLNISCEANPLTSLDVSKVTSLRYFSCSNNQLSELDLSKNINLEQIWCRRNQFSVEALNRLFGTLNNKSVFSNNKQITISGNPGADNCNRSIAENKGWAVKSEQ